jgi:hypothetical protein
MKMRKLKALAGIGTLILGWWLDHSAWAANPITSLDQAITVTEIIGAFAEIGRLFRPANDVVSPTGNVWIGWQSQIECSNSQGFKSEVPGLLPPGVAPCLPNTVYPPFGAGFQVDTGLTDGQCAFRAGVAARAVAHTALVALEGGQPGIKPYTGVSFIIPDPNPDLVTVTGGICSSNGTHTFEGYLGIAGFYINPNVWSTILGPGKGISGVQCAHMVNACSGPCSCGGYSHFE